MSGSGTLSLSVTGSPPTQIARDRRGPTQRALGVRVRRSLSRGPALSCVEAQLSLCGALALSVSGPVLSVSDPGALCVRARRSPCQARCSVCRLVALCRAPALSVSGPGALCVGLSRSVLGPATVSNWVPGPQLRSACSSACHPSGPRAPSSDPHAAHSVPVPPMRSPSQSVGPMPPAPIRVPPIQSCKPPAQIRVPPSSPARSFFPGENRKPYCLWENVMWNSKIQQEELSYNMMGYKMKD